jgi:colanic acid biosynthesis glycosyl transferase WcaI
MKILLVNQYYPPDSAPTGQFLENLAVALVRDGHQVRVICSKGYYCGSKAYSTAASVEGVEVVRLRAFCFGRRNLFVRLLDYLSFFFLALIRSLFGPRPDVVVCLTTPPYIGFVGFAMRLFRRVRVVQWVMDLYPDSIVAHGMLRESSLGFRVLAYLTRRLFRSADTIWALGPFASRKILAYVRPEEADKVEVIPLWADKLLSPLETGENPMRVEYGLNGQCVVMYSGNMGLGHEFDTFIGGAKHFDNQSHVRFLFVGGGTRSKEVKRKTQESDLANVEFRPYAPRERLRESLSVGDIHIVSQLPAWQGCIVPSKMAGILAVGKPVVFVGDQHNEIAHWIDEAQSGFVVRLGDCHAFARTIEKLKNDPELRRRLGRNGRAFYEKHLSGDVNLAKLVASIGRAVQKPRSAESRASSVGQAIPAEADVADVKTK